MSVFLFCECCFFFKCFSNFLVSRLTFSFNFPLLLHRLLLTTVTFTKLHARLLLLFNKLYVCLGLLWIYTAIGCVK